MNDKIKPRLLIVEDDAIVVADLTIRLTQMGYEVVGSANCGAVALSLAEQHHPDLVVMDIRLQGPMDGIDVAKELRACCQMPVVFLSAYGEDSTLQRAQEAEPLGYVLKPFEDRELRIVLEMALYKRQAELRIQASELRHRSILEAAMNGFWLVDSEGRLQEVNQSYCRMSGYSAAELLTMRISDLDINESAAEVAAHIQAVTSTGADRFETRHRRKDGSIFDVEVSAQYQLAEGGRLVSFVRDITALKLTEVYRVLRHEVLGILNEPGTMRQSIRRVLAAVQARTGAAAVAMRLQDGEDFPYFAQHGFSKEFMRTETSIVERGADGSACRDCAGAASLVCTCGLVIAGKTDPTHPLFTPQGSFWTNDSAALLDLPPDLDPRRNPRNRCIHEGYASFALVPIRTKDSVVGLIQINDRRKGFFTLHAIEILESMAAHIGEALLRQGAEETLRQSKEDLHVLAARLNAVREEERASLARELHDFFGQHLTAMQIELLWMDRHLQSEPPVELSALYDKIVAMEPIIERLTEHTQTLCAALRPSVLYDLGLLAAIEWQVEDTAKRCGLIGKWSLPANDLELDDERALALFRIVQEALINVVRHAQATQVDVMLHTEDDALQLEIQDNGRGFPPEAHPGSQALGLLGMRERIDAFGGTVEFLSPPGHGACVRVRMPYRPHHHQPIAHS